MSSPEYIATGTVSPAPPGYFDDLLDTARQMPGVQIKKVASRYVVLVANDDDVKEMACRLGGKYQFAPNRDISLFE